MSTRKNKELISTEDLMNMVDLEADRPNLTKKEKKRKENETVLAFIRAKSITSGLVRVPTYKIFHEYQVMWTARNRNDKIGRTGFFRIFSRYFEQIRTGKQRYYLLNDCFDMSEESMKRAENHKNVNKRKKNV